MSGFRSIALCNVSYKIISNILVGHLKPHMSSILSIAKQPSYQKNTMDNMIIAYEMLHLKFRSVGIIVKTDISEAYDRL